MSDRAAVVMACAAALGALAVVPFPWLVWLGIVGVVAAFGLRRQTVLIVAVAVLCSGLAALATARQVVEAGSWQGTVEVVHVSLPAGGDIHAEVRAGDHHLDLIPTGRVLGVVRSAGPGDRLIVHGRIAPLDPHDQRARGSHVAGRLHSARIEAGPSPSLPWRIAGAVRGGVRGLGEVLPESEQALFNGFVMGDASGQTTYQQADFQSSGLTHLLVASGENVAFVLVLAAPLLTRVGFRGRWVITGGLLIGYSLVTGLEPSVLRAATMAAVAVSAAGLGRPVRSWRSLAIAVTVLLVADPFLVHSVAFLLSVGASAGILALARPVAKLLGGPRRLREPLAVTIGAQVGVAPVLLGFPGGLPVATLPANLLAAIPAGLVMVAGLPCLVLAATPLPGAWAAVWVPRLLLGWIDGVARTTAGLGLGYLTATMVIVAVAGLGVALAAGRLGHGRLRRFASVVAATGVLWPVITGTGSFDEGRGGLAVVRRSGTVVVVLTGRVPASRLLRDLSLDRVRRADLVVVPHGDDEDRALVAAIAHRTPIGTVLAPRPGRFDGSPALVARKGHVVAVGRARIEVIATAPVLTVHVVAGAGQPSG